MRSDLYLIFNLNASIAFGRRIDEGLNYINANQNICFTNECASLLNEHVNVNKQNCKKGI